MRNQEPHVDVCLNTKRFFLFLANSYSLMNFIMNNQRNVSNNSFIHNITKRNKQQLHKTNANLSCFRKNAFYAGVKILNILRRSLNILKNI